MLQSTFSISPATRRVLETLDEEVVQRGVIDLRDLVYYGSLTFFFLTLSVGALRVKRWG